MPLKKPKPVRAPLPFQLPQHRADDAGRRRALVMNHLLDTEEGYSWNRPRLSLWRRLRKQSPHQIAGSLFALLMALLIAAAFVLGMDSGIHPPEFIIYIEDWSANRSADDARLERDLQHHRLDLEPARRSDAQALAQREALARQKALEAERAAARQATPN